MLFSLLRNAWSLTFTSALAGFFVTILTVRLFGPVAFADYVIDLAKLSLLVLASEAVPSPFSIFEQQRSQEFKDSLPVYYLFAASTGLLLVWLMNLLGLFSSFTNWIYIYSFCMVFQRYFDCRFQAEGRTKEFYFLPLITNIVRLLSLLFITLVFRQSSPSSIIWSSLTIGAFVSITTFSIRNIRDVRIIDFSKWNAALLYLWQLRSAYYSYYPNIILKRLRDTAMPLICDFFVQDRLQTGLYLLAYRGVDVVCGQLRVIEAFYSNFTLRKRLAIGRKKTMFSVALMGQFAAMASGLILAGQVNLDFATIKIVVFASFLIYPYTSEILSRSDAYADFRPQQVTTSLLVYAISVILLVSIAYVSTTLTAHILIFTQLTSQTFAALSYRLSRLRY